MPFTVQRLSVPGVLVIEPQVFGDERGFFMEIYKRSEFEALGITEHFQQENHSRSERGILRGLHFQTGEHAQAKLVRVVAGEIFDVAVDIQDGSPTRGQWVGVNLSSDNRRMMYVPAHCAHGFCVMSESAEVVYLTSTEYAPTHESGLMWNDPALGITWPLTSAPVLSARDKNWPAFLR